MTLTWLSPEMSPSNPDMVLITMVTMPLFTAFDRPEDMIIENLHSETQEKFNANLTYNLLLPPMKMKSNRGN